MNYGPAAKRSQLTVAMLYKDTARKMDVVDPVLAVANTNLGLKERYTFSRQSKIVKMVRPLFCDMFRSERLLLSFVDLKVILNLNINDFCLMASVDDVDYRVKLTESYLKIRNCSSISIAQELALKKGPAIYPVRRVECNTFIIVAGNPSLRKDNLYNELEPKMSCSEWSTVQHSMESTRKTLTTLKALPTPSLASWLQLSYAAANRRYIEAYLAMFSGTGKVILR